MRDAFLDVAVNLELEGFVLDAALRIPPGVERLSLFGPSGAGKSLFLRVLAGILRPRRGWIRVNGDLWFDDRAGVWVPPERRRVGYVPQTWALFPHRTAAENVAYGLARWPRPRREARVAQLLRWVRLEDQADRLPEELSGGQRQRVALARALAPRPRLLLLDEPLSALDVLTRDRLRRELLNLLEAEAVPTLTVTHDLEEAMVLGQWLAVMDEGRIVQAGPARQVLERPASRRVARLLGARNLLDGELEAILPEGWGWYRTRLGPLVAPLPPEARPGEAWTLVARPERIRFLWPDRPRPSVNVVEAEMVRLQDRGTSQTWFARVPGSPRSYDLEIWIPTFVARRLGVQVGSRWRLHLRPEDLWTVPGRKGRRP